MASDCKTFLYSLICKHKVIFFNKYRPPEQKGKRKIWIQFPKSISIAKKKKLLTGFWDGKMLFIVKQTELAKDTF